MAFLNSGKYDNSRKRYKTETDLQWKTNRKLQAAYKMEPLPMTLSDPVGHFSGLKPFRLLNWGNIARISQDMCTCELENVRGL